MIAIAAMSRNRVIGDGDRIPWRIPDELKWFRRTTMGGLVVMGRRTFDSLPKPLDGRITAVLTHDPSRLLAEPRFAAATVVSSPEEARRAVEENPAEGRRTALWLSPGIEPFLGVERVWLCGGAQVYRQFLDRCRELHLTVVDREAEGDAVFPPFEHLFEEAGVVFEHPEFRVLRFTRRG